MPIDIPSTIDVQELYEELGGEAELVDFAQFESRVAMYMRLLKRNAARPTTVLRPSRSFTALNQMSKPQRQFFFKLGQWSEIPTGLSKQVSADPRRPTGRCSYSPDEGIVTAWWAEVFEPPRKRRDTARAWDDPISAGALEILEAASRALKNGKTVSQLDISCAFARSCKERAEFADRLIAFDEKFDASHYIDPAAAREGLAAMLADPEVGIDIDPNSLEVSWETEPVFAVRAEPWQDCLGVLAQEGFWTVGYEELEGEGSPGVAVFHDGERMVAGLVENVAQTT